MVFISAHLYREAGLTSARVGTVSRIGKIKAQYERSHKLVEEMVECRVFGIFANARELIIENEKRKQEKQAK